jgi:hypothetical protein
LNQARLAIRGARFGPEDKSELCWRIGMSLVIEEADLSDWKTGNFKQLAIFAERKFDPEPEQ